MIIPVIERSNRRNIHAIKSDVIGIPLIFNLVVLIVILFGNPIELRGSFHSEKMICESC